MRDEQWLRTRTPESRAFAERGQLVMTLTARLNVLPFDDLEARRQVLTEIFGGPIPGCLSILPPFYCDYGLGHRSASGCSSTRGDSSSISVASPSGTAS